MVEIYYNNKKLTTQLLKCDLLSGIKYLENEVNKLIVQKTFDLILDHQKSISELMKIRDNFLYSQQKQTS